MEQNSNQSEVNRLLEGIERAYQAARAALDGYAVTAQHAFITARMEQMGQMHDHLQELVGPDAIRLIVERLEALSE